MDKEIAVALGKPVSEERQAIENTAGKETVWVKLKIFGLIFAFAILLLFYYGPTFPGLKQPTQSVLGVFLWFIVVMISDALPNAIVGITSPLLLVLFAKMPIPQAFNAFNTDIFFLAAGAFIIAAIMMGTPLGKRITLAIASIMKSSRVLRVMLGLSLAELATHPVIPVVNETALFLPICKGMGSLMEGKGSGPEIKRINTAVLYFIAGILPLFIGPLFLTSHFPNLILVAYLKETQHLNISWGQWLWLNVPLWGLLPIAYFYVAWYFRLQGLVIPGAEKGIANMREELGKITWPEIWALICILLGMILWITGWIPPGMAALVVAFLLFVPWGGIEFKTISKHILWDVLILLGGAISLGTALYNSGCVTWLSDIIVEPIKSLHLPVLIILLILAFGLHIARAGIVSAVAAGAAFVPLVAGLARALDYNVLPFSLVIINCLSYAFFLPISITAFLIAWSASGTSSWEAIKFGAPLSIIANIYVILVQPAWLGLIGYPLR
jgi:solute carrier family 13 (sodium-dependent dicarboxylate transporter), member 2/3/5